MNVVFVRLVDHSHVDLDVVLCPTKEDRTSCYASHARLCLAAGYYPTSSQHEDWLTVLNLVNAEYT